MSRAKTRFYCPLCGFKVRNENRNVGKQQDRTYWCAYCKIRWRIEIGVGEYDFIKVSQGEVSQ